MKFSIVAIISLIISFSAVGQEYRDSGTSQSTYKVIIVDSSGRQVVYQATSSEVSDVESALGEDQVEAEASDDSLCEGCDYKSSSLIPFPGMFRQQQRQQQQQQQLGW